MLRPRLGLPRELIGTAIFLASDASELVTGHIVMCDDGYMTLSYEDQRRRWQKSPKAHHTGFTVNSLERSIAFYRDLLGLELVFQWNPQAPYISELVGYPEVDMHARCCACRASETFLELLEYRNIPQQAGGHGQRQHRQRPYRLHGGRSGDVSLPDLHRPG